MRAFPANAPLPDEFRNVRHFSVSRRGSVVRLSGQNCWALLPPNYSLCLVNPLQCLFLRVIQEGGWFASFFKYIPRGFISSRAYVCVHRDAQVSTRALGWQSNNSGRVQGMESPWFVPCFLSAPRGKWALPALALGCWWWPGRALRMGKAESIRGCHSLVVLVEVVMTCWRAPDALQVLHECPAGHAAGLS